MKRLLLVTLLTALLLVGCSKAKEVAGDLEELKAAGEELQQAAEKAGEVLEQIDEDTNNDETDDTDNNSENNTSTDETPIGETNDTSDATLIEDGVIYEGTIAPEEMITFLVEAKEGEKLSALVKTDSKIIGKYKDVIESESSESGFYLSNDKGLFTKTCDDGSVFFILKSEQKKSVNYAFLIVHGEKDLLKTTLVEKDGLILPSENVGTLKDAAFLSGDLGISINEVQFYKENTELGFPSYDNKMYLQFNGIINNNGTEPIIYGREIYETVLDIYGERAANGNNWLQDESLNTEIAPGDALEFKHLYLVDATSTKLTVSFKNNTSKEQTSFVIDTSEASATAATEQQASDDAKVAMLSELSKSIIKAIDFDSFTDIIPYSDLATISSVNQDIATDKQQYFEDYSWENCASNEDILLWGASDSGGDINLTCSEFFDQYISGLDYINGTFNIVKTSRDDEQPYDWITPAYTNYYAEITAPDGENILYLQYEEVEPDHYKLIGIRYTAN